MSTTFTNLALTTYPDALDIALPFEVATRSSTNWDINEDEADYVMAVDVNVLQDAILALQGFVGVTNSTVITEATTNIMARLGVLMTNISTGTSALTNHLHNGTGANPVQIDLTAHVTGALPATNINRTGATGSINATNLFMGADGAGLAMSVAIGNKLDKTTGGIVSGNISATQLISTVAIGTSPLAVTSTTLVTNLNADLLDGKQGNEYGTLTGTETFTNKTLTSPKINENVALTATATQLNYVTGVTSAIQTQLGAKADLVTGKVPLSQLPNSGGSIVAATAPTNTDILWIDTTAGGILKYWNGSAWVQAKYSYV